MGLKRTNDRKTTVRANKAGKQSLIKNAFSLPSGKAFSCPGATGVCETICYAGRIEKQYPAFLAVAMHNWELLKDAPLDVMIDLLSEMITEFANECEKHNVPKLFRWHADGDIFSATYAEAIEAVCLEFPDVHFWIYTRSFEYVGFITSIPNLSVYLSVDKENLNAGLLCAADNPGVKMAYLGETFNEGKEIFETLTGVPGGKCPENAKQIPLITEKGGACVTCGLCIFGKADIRFSRTKK
jgi:ferredoxin